MILKSQSIWIGCIETFTQDFKEKFSRESHSVDLEHGPPKSVFCNKFSMILLQLWVWKL